MKSTVEVTQHDDIALVRMNAPANRNALTKDMCIELANGLAVAQADTAVRAIVLTGSGGEFCAGGDMKAAIADDDPPAIRTPRLLALLHRLAREIACGPKPVIAAVDGHAFGAGLSLVTVADYVVAGPTARFCAAFGRVGLFPDAGLVWSLPNRVGPVRARQMVLTANVVDVQTAADWGLVDEIDTSDDTVKRALENARDYTRIAPLAAASVRATMGIEAVDMEAAFAAEIRIQPILTDSADYAEARAAFAKKRRATFTGR